MEFSNINKHVKYKKNKEDFMNKKKWQNERRYQWERESVLKFVQKISNSNWEKEILQAEKNQRQTNEV